MKATIYVYFKSGQVFHYDIEASDIEELASKAREHEYKIITTGFRHSGGKNEHTWYLPHWIDKVKVIGIDVKSIYRDQASGT